MSRNLHALLVTTLLCAALAAWQTWPALAHPNSTVIGFWLHPDCLSNHWLLEWVSDQVCNGGGILHNDRYYWPVGDAPVLAGNGAEGFFYVPFHLLWRWPTSVVAYVLVVLTLDGLAGWALARAAGASPWASLVTAAASGSAPYLMRELSSGRFTQVSVFWLLFFLAAWLNLLAHPRARNAVLAGVLLAATSFFYWYYGFFGVLAGAVLLAFRARRALLAPLALFVATFLALIAPWAWTFFTAWAAIPGASEFTAFPHPQAMIDARRPGLPFDYTPGNTLGQTIGMALPTWLLGLVGVGFAVVAAARRRPEWRLPAALLLCWLLFWSLSLGPTFTGAPYTLLYGFAPPLRRFWWPGRHIALSAPLWAVLAALALDRLRPRFVPVVAVLLTVVTVPVLSWQGAVAGSQTTHVRLPPRGYDQLAALPDGVLVEPPLAPELGATQEHLVYQLFHHKTLLTGHAMWVDRVRPDTWDAFVAGNTFLAELQRFERAELQGEFAFDGVDLIDLQRQGVRWFAINRAYFVFPLRDLLRAYDHLFDRLFGRPVIRGRMVTVWDASQWQGTTRVTVPRWQPGSDMPAPTADLPLPAKRPASQVFDPFEDKPEEPSESALPPE